MAVVVISLGNEDRPLEWSSLSWTDQEVKLRVVARGPGVDKRRLLCTIYNTCTCTSTVGQSTVACTTGSVLECNFLPLRTVNTGRYDWNWN